MSTSKVIKGHFVRKISCGHTHIQTDTHAQPSYMLYTANKQVGKTDPE